MVDRGEAFLNMASRSGKHLMPDQFVSVLQRGRYEASSCIYFQLVRRALVVGSRLGDDLERVLQAGVGWYVQQLPFNEMVFTDYVRGALSGTHFSLDFP